MKKKSFLNIPFRQDLIKLIQSEKCFGLLIHLILMFLYIFIYFFYLLPLYFFLYYFYFYVIQFHLIT